MNHPNKELMEKAINLAREKYMVGGHAVASIIAREDKIISQAFTTVDLEKDCTCHAEINAIRLACKKLGSKKLENCYLYTTYEPCPMCSSAGVWARLKGIVFGSEMGDETEKCPQRIKVRCLEILMKGNPKLELFPSFMRKECKELLGL
jgi:tRNA(Arg) A34 adenosine deaminase TadA